VRVGSLFSGIGGLDLGLERAGMEVIWQVEADPKCREVLNHHWPKVEVFDDVRTAGSDNLGSVDLICGGFPCQDLSVAGKRRGLDGDRSGLWEEFRRVVSELRPEWVLIENVPGLLSSNEGRDMGVVVRELEQLGYGWSYRVLDSQYFGVAQRRRRVFIVGHSSVQRCAEVLFDAASLQRHPPTRRESGQGITGALTGGASSSSAGNPDDNRAQAGFVVTHTLTAEGHDAGEDGTGRGVPLVAFNCQQTPVSDSRDATGTSGGADQAVCYGFDKGQSSNPKATEQLSEEQAPPLISNRTTGACVAFAENQRGELETSEAQHQLSSGGGKPGQGYPAIYHENISGNLASAEHARALRSGASHSYQFTGSSQPRRLTPTECERLQGFPDDWTAINGMADSPRYRMLGNAVTVQVAEWIGRQILNQTDQQTSLSPSTRRASTDHHR
jgi:DNA (cytosine-5)-methyltransferase 1